jgi:hypothetical protein
MMLFPQLAGAIRKTAGRLQHMQAGGVGVEGSLFRGANAGVSFARWKERSMGRLASKIDRKIDAVFADVDVPQHPGAWRNPSPEACASLRLRPLPCGER